MKYYIIGNWKMNPSSAEEATNLAQGIANKVNNSAVETVIMPPFVWLSNIKSVLEKGSDVVLAAQNMFWKESGAFTGEISPAMLISLGVKYVMIGHSERELYLKEDREMVRNKLNLAIRSGLIAIVSFRPKNFDGLEKELLEMTDEIEDKTKIFYLYEPTEAISTQGAKIPPKENIETFAKITRKTLGKDVIVIYGGSLNSENTSELIVSTGINGGLVGAKSLNIEEFVNIVNELKE